MWDKVCPTGARNIYLLPPLTVVAAAARSCRGTLCKFGGRFSRRRVVFYPALGEGCGGRPRGVCVRSSGPPLPSLPPAFAAGLCRIPFAVIFSLHL